MSEPILYGPLDIEWVDLTNPCYGRSDHVHVKSLRRQALDKEMDRLKELIDDEGTD